MRVLKFGGTSVGSAKRMHEVAEIVNDGIPKIVVLSAMSGTTNKLVELSEYLKKQNTEGASELINNLEFSYLKTIEEIYNTQEFKDKGKELVKSHFEYLRGFTRNSFTTHQEKSILAQGELLSTAMFNFHLQEMGVDSILLPALNFMRIDKNEEPDDFYIRENVRRELEKYPGVNLFVTQGFICRNAYGEVDNLKRGGSDYSASIMGAAVDSDEIQIWTDIDGFHNNDPRIVDKTRAISHLSFDEAAELAYFGAKIMHPSSVLPAKLANIPVRLKNTMAPAEAGTLITSNYESGGIRAVAAKDGITSVKIKSGRMLMAYGFLRKVFEVFEVYRTSIDMVTTSEVAVSVTIDDDKYLEEIVRELKKFGTVEIDPKQTIVCVVGDFIASKAGMAAQVFDAMNQVPIRAISYGGSFHNISMLVAEEHKVAALKALNKAVLHNE